MAELHPNSKTPTSRIVRGIKTQFGDIQYLFEDGSIWSFCEVSHYDHEKNRSDALIYWIKCVWFDDEKKIYHQLSENEYQEIRVEFVKTGLTILSERRKGKH